MLILRFSPAAFERVRQWPMRFTGPSAIGDSHLARIGRDLTLALLAPDDQPLIELRRAPFGQLISLSVPDL